MLGRTQAKPTTVAVGELVRQLAAQRASALNVVDAHLGRAVGADNPALADALLDVRLDLSAALQQGAVRA